MKYLRQLLKQFTEKTSIAESLDQIRSLDENRTEQNEKNVRNEMEDIDTLTLHQSRITTLEKENLILKKELENLSSQSTKVCYTSSFYYYYFMLLYQ